MLPLPLCHLGPWNFLDTLTGTVRHCVYVLMAAFSVLQDTVAALSAPLYHGDRIVTISLVV